MPRMKGTPNIVGWKEHCLIRDLALGEENPEALAEKYDLPIQTVYQFRWTRTPRIAAVLQDWSNKFSDLWAVEKHARIADLIYLAGTIQDRMFELLEDAELATETMRRVHPDAAPVRVPTREWNRCVAAKARLLDQIEASMGQRSQDVGVLYEGLSVPGRLTRAGLHHSEQVRDQAKKLAPQPQPDREEPKPAFASSLPDPLQLIRERMALMDASEGRIDALIGNYGVADGGAEDDDEDEPETPEDGEVDQLFRAMPSVTAPAGDTGEPETGDDVDQADDITIDPTPEPEPEAEPEPAKPPVPYDIEHGARAVASEVRSRGAAPRSYLFRGMNGHAAEVLNYALEQDWVLADGDLVLAGAVNPQPMSALPRDW